MSWEKQISQGFYAFNSSAYQFLSGNHQDECFSLAAYAGEGAKNQVANLLDIILLSHRIYFNKFFYHGSKARMLDLQCKKIFKKFIKNNLHFGILLNSPKYWWLCTWGDITGFKYENKALEKIEFVTHGVLDFEKQIQAKTGVELTQGEKDYHSMFLLMSKDTVSVVNQKKLISLIDTAVDKQDSLANLAKNIIDTAIARRKLGNYGVLVVTINVSETLIEKKPTLKSVFEL